MVPDADRPDPDALLRRVQADEARARRGRLKIFFGASAGVGKTCAMLSAAQAALKDGVPLVLGLVETHGRADTERLARGLPRLPLKPAAEGQPSRAGFDLDAALAWGREHPGGLVLVDELAHSNPPGSRHPKRWQDVRELRDAGLDVWTTINVQHLESLNDIVSGITGVKVRETVPDHVFDEADDVVVVDLPPDELIARLAAGKVYLPEQAERAAAHFFRKGNLLALRELALRRTADRVDDQMQAWRSHGATAPVWPNREALLACIGSAPGDDKVVRSAARLAAQLELGWHAVHVEPPGARPGARAEALKQLRLAQELGATTATLAAPEPAAALVRYAREHNLSRLVIGRRGRRLRWRVPLAERLARHADDLDVLQVAVPARAAAAGAPVDAPGPQDDAALWPQARGYLAAVAACGLTALAATPLLGVFELTNIVMLFLLAVVAVALTAGRGPAVLAAFLGVALFDFCFVPPRFSFAVSDVQYLLTFAVMLIVALVVGQLTAGLKTLAEAALRREERVRGLYAMARDLSAALLPLQVAEIGTRFVATEFGVRAVLVVAEADDRLAAVEVAGGAGLPPAELSLARWAYDHAEAAGRGTHTLPASAWLMLPLAAPMRLRGVLAVEAGAAGEASRLLGPEPRRLLDTCASLLAISLERIHYIDVAQASTLQIESERLRHSLLAAISHDLRTPLAALVGLADTLALAGPPPSARQSELIGAIRQSAGRMNRLVTNLLDMARLQSGRVQLRLQWQPLEEVVGSAVAACRPLLEGRPLRVALPAELPLLQLDAMLFERVLVNLLENAAKYTPAGSAIEIGADADATTVRLHVDDHGAGLPAGREEALFQKFERGTRESATHGVGLGLAICRAIVEAHGGSIVAARAPGGGARFTIELPRGEPPLDDGSEVSPAEALTTPATA